MVRGFVSSELERLWKEAMWLNFEECLVIYVVRLMTRKDSARMMHREAEN
jgi:hypothetical protein